MGVELLGKLVWQTLIWSPTCLENRPKKAYSHLWSIFQGRLYSEFCNHITLSPWCRHPQFSNTLKFLVIPTKHCLNSCIMEHVARQRMFTFRHLLNCCAKLVMEHFHHWKGLPCQVSWLMVKRLVHFENWRCGHFVNYLSSCLRIVNNSLNEKTI